MRNQIKIKKLGSFQSFLLENPLLNLKPKVNILLMPNFGASSNIFSNLMINKKLLSIVNPISFIYRNHKNSDYFNNYDIPSLAKDTSDFITYSKINKEKFFILGHREAGVVILEFLAKYKENFENLKGICISDGLPINNLEGINKGFFRKEKRFYERINSIKLNEVKNYEEIDKVIFKLGLDKYKKKIYKKIYYDKKEKSFNWNYDIEKFSQGEIFNKLYNFVPEVKRHENIPLLFLYSKFCPFIDKNRIRVFKEYFDDFDEENSL